MGNSLISINREVAKKHLHNLLTAVLYLVIIATCIALCIGCLALAAIALHQLKNLRINSKLVLYYTNALKYPLLILFFGLFFQRPIKKFLNEADSIDTKIGKFSRKRPGLQEGDPTAVRALSADAKETLNDDTPTDDGGATGQLEEQLTTPEAIAEYHRIFSIIWGS